MNKKETLLKENPWRTLAEKIEKNGYMPLRNEPNACADDIRFIEEFNVRTKSESFKLHTEVLPYPFIGNVLDAKVVVLMLNPGYVPDANERDWGKLTDVEKRFVTVEQCKGMRLEDRKIYYAEPEYEAFNKIQTYYWMKKTRELRAAVSGAEEHIAAIQLMGYHSVKYKSFPKNMGLLPSQEYTKRLVKYLISRGVVFVFARAVKNWHMLVPELKDATCVELKSYLNPCLTEKNCFAGGFEKLKVALSK